MADKTIWRNVATLVRRAPWLVQTGRVFWRIHQPRFTAGVVGVVFNQDEQILLVEHVFHPHRPWGLPGGWIERREDPATAVARELLEELELTVEIGPLLLAELGYGNHLDLAYMCEIKGEIGTLSSELLDYRWINPLDLPRLHNFHYNAIQQALTIRNGMKL